MLKKTFTYVDYNGIERTEHHYFNLNESELMEMELTTAGGFVETIKAIVDAKDQPALVKIFKEFILKAYGQKSPDGTYFDKSEEISRRFSNTKAYSMLFMELATDSAAATAFINGVIPADLAEKSKQANVTALPQATN